MWAIDTAHGLLISEYGSAELQLFDFSDHACIARIDLADRPTGLASEGDFAWVGSDSGHCVYKVHLPDLAVCCTSNTRYERIENHDEYHKEGVFARIFGVALFADRLYVTDVDNGRIVVLDPETLAWRFSFGRDAIGVDVLAEPTGLTIHENGEDLVVCDHHHEVLVFYDPFSGGFNGVLHLTDDMHFSKPWDVASYRGFLIVTQEPHPMFRGMFHEPIDVDYVAEHAQIMVVAPWFQEQMMGDVFQVVSLPRVHYPGNPHPSLRGTRPAMAQELHPGFNGIHIDARKSLAYVVDSEGRVQAFGLRDVPTRSQWNRF